MGRTCTLSSAMHGKEWPAYKPMLNALFKYYDDDSYKNAPVMCFLL